MYHPNLNTKHWLFIKSPMTTVVVNFPCINSLLYFFTFQLLQQLKRLICDLCRLYNLPQHPDVEMLDQPLPACPITQERKVGSENESRVCQNQKFSLLTRIILLYNSMGQQMR